MSALGTIASCLVSVARIAHSERAERNTMYRVQSTETTYGVLFRPAPNGGFFTHELLEKERGRGDVIKNKIKRDKAGTTGKKQETGAGEGKEPIWGGRRVGGARTRVKAPLG